FPCKTSIMRQCCISATKSRFKNINVFRYLPNWLTVKRRHPGRWSWHDSQILIPNLTFDLPFGRNTGGKLELQPLGLAVRCRHLECNRKIGPRQRAGYKFGICESLRRVVGTKNMPP